MQQYVASARTRLEALHFTGMEIPSELQSRLSALVARTEEWGRLLLGLACEDMADPSARERLVNACGSWMNARRESGEVCHMIVVFPFFGKVAEATADQIRALRRESPDRQWSVIPWTADLESELVDQHSGFPRVHSEVANAVTEVPGHPRRAGWASAMQTRVGRLGNVTEYLQYLPFTRLTLAGMVAYSLFVLLENGGFAACLGGPVEYVCWGANNGRLVIEDGQNWRLITHLFIHSGLIHLLLNMWALWQAGKQVELLYGSTYSAFVYYGAGVAGGMASTVLRPDYVTTVGSSGAVMGLLGAMILFASVRPRHRVDWRSVALPVLLTFLYGFWAPGVDLYAHLGGFGGGVLAAWIAGVPGNRAPIRAYAMYAILLAGVAVLSGLVRLPHLPIF